MGKRFRIWLFVFVLAAIIVIGFNFKSITGMSISEENSDSVNIEKMSSLINGLSDEEIAEQLDSSFVVYLLKNIGASNLHNVPLTSNNPKLELVFEEKTFNAQIIKGKIFVEEGEIEDEDVLIFTNKIEAAKMIRDSKYIVESFKGGRAGMKIISSKPELLAKGYLDLQNSLVNN